MYKRQGITFLPNDRYLLENGKFRLYYTAEGEEAHNFIVVVEDNFGNSSSPTRFRLGRIRPSYT